MMDDKLASEEARRAEQHNAVRSGIEGDIQAELARNGNHAAPGEAQKIEQVAGDFRSKALGEVVATEREVGTARVAARVSQIIDYLFYVVYALLAVRFALALIAARSSAGFVKFIVGASDPFYGPFRGIVETRKLDGGHTVVLPLAIAIAVYILIHVGINALLRLIAHRKTAI